MASGAESTITVYVTGAVPPEVRGAVSSMVREMGYLAAGNAPLVSQLNEADVMLGLDRAGDQVSLRESMLPMFAFFVLLVEMMALATLVASEVQERTVTAILATPATVGDFLAAKTMVGHRAGLHGGDGPHGATRSARHQHAHLGALSLPRRQSSSPGSPCSWDLSARISSRSCSGACCSSSRWRFPESPCCFPGRPLTWVKALPSWGLSEAIVQATSYGIPVSDLVAPLVSLVAWTIVALVAGMWALKRKVASL